MNMLENSNLSPEEILGPPKIDIIGVGLITFLGFVVGLLVGGGVLMMVFFSFGQFLMQSGASSILIAMFAFIALTIGNSIYLWGLASIFPHIYTRARSLFVQVSVFSVLLYICMSFAYFTIGMIYPSTTGLLSIYAAHVIINVFGFFLVTGILSQYRYALLTFYSSIASFVLTSIFTFWIFSSLSKSASILFVFMGLAMMVYLFATIIHFTIAWLYTQLYMYSGADPLGDVLHSIEIEEKALEDSAEKSLFTKK